MFKPKSALIQELQSRGYIHQCTNIVELDKLANKKKIVAYIGFDCTAESLHVGSLIQLMLIRILQKTGHQVIVLLGDGTSKIGDPSGKDKSRKLLDDIEIKKNSENIKKDFKKNFSSNKITNIICTNLKNISKYLKNTNLLINSTPLGMKGFPNLNINIKDLDKKAVVFDLVYNPLKTKLIKDSEKLGLKNTNGLDMLIYQAQQAFYYWLKKKPAVTKELKNILENEIK